MWPTVLRIADLLHSSTSTVMQDSMIIGAKAGVCSPARPRPNLEQFFAESAFAPKRTRISRQFLAELVPKGREEGGNPEVQSRLARPIVCDEPKF